MLYVSRVRLENVRCFDNLDVNLDTLSEAANWVVFVGDNATGKSTLLRSIALGLCDEASAAGLLKESDEGYIRRGEERACITIWLRDSKTNSRFRIRTTVSRKKGKREIFSDRVRQSISPRNQHFPRDELFVSGYGAGRGVTGAADISSYSTIDAVYNMFNYTEGLQNPELVIRRIMMAGDWVNPVENRQIFKVLSKAVGASKIGMTTQGIRVDGPWGSGMPLRDLADGYKSSVLWITDLLGWALAYNPRRKGFAGIRGIVLIDELEQHLHVRWQRTIVDDLRKLFPNIQFITSTHSPLIGSSVGPSMEPVCQDRLYILETSNEGRVKACPHEFMRGWRMDQVLASRAFKYQIEADPEIARTLRVGSRLAAKTRQLTQEEREVYQRIKDLLQKSFFSSTSPVETAVERQAQQQLRDEISKLEKKLFPDESL